MRFWSIVIFVIVFIVSTLFAFLSIKEDSIKIGLLYSKTGTMATEERVISQMLHYRIEKINRSGGILNKKIEIIEYDGKSDPKEFKKGAEYFVSKGVKTIFGCWTSASRKAVKDIVEKNNMVLFYPVQYEGVEESKNIVYLGTSANQQINPTISYIMDMYGKDVYIVGSDYIYPRMAGVYIDELSKLIGLTILKSDYYTLGANDFKKTIESIKKLKPKAIINTLNGSSNKAFFEQLKINGIDSVDIPVFSMSLDESGINKIGEDLLEGHFGVWSYFNSLNDLENKDLKKDLKKRFGDDFILTDAGYNIYLGIGLWHRAIMTSKDYDVDNILKNIKRDSLNTSIGIVYVDPNNNHLHKNLRIGKIEKGEFKSVWVSDVLTKPSPFPIFKSKEFWLEHENRLYKSWGNHWQYVDTKGKKDE